MNYILDAHCYRKSWQKKFSRLSWIAADKFTLFHYNYWLTDGQTKLIIKVASLLKHFLPGIFLRLQSGCFFQNPEQPSNTKNHTLNQDKTFKGEMGVLRKYFQLTYPIQLAKNLINLQLFWKRMPPIGPVVLQILHESNYFSIY